MPGRQSVRTSGRELQARGCCGRALFVLALFALALLCAGWPTPLQAGAQGGVPQAVWQDSERNHRRSPSQIKRQLRPPQVRAAQIPLAAGAQDQRAARTQIGRASCRERV